MKYSAFIKKQQGIIEDALRRFENNELQANEYLGFQSCLITSCDKFLGGFIFSPLSRFGESLNDVKFDCTTVFGCVDTMYRKHYYQFGLENCCIHMTIDQEDDTYTIHYVFQGEEAAREKYFHEIETMIDEISTTIS